MSAVHHIFLARAPLVPAPEIALWASYTSVNPKLLLAALEFRSGLISEIPAGWSTDDVLAEIEDTSLTMATAFYEHRHSWGAQQPSVQRGREPPPVVRLQDGVVIELDPGGSSASFALAALLARSTDTAGFRAALAQEGSGSFQAVFGSLFPSVDLLDTSNQIDPPGTPPASLLQMPFALGATWTFGGPHSWNGNSTPPFSSMDFFIRGGTCPAPPYQFSVAAASGTAYRPYGYSCWLEINHGFGWTTSYYHLQNLTAELTTDRNAPLGTIACEICAGGYATARTSISA
jgi:LasA protease